MDNWDMDIKIKSISLSWLNILKKIILKQKMLYVVKNIPQFLMKTDKYIHLDMGVKIVECS